MIHALICTEASNMQLCYKLTSTLQRIDKVHILQKQVHINFTSLHIQADVCKKKLNGGLYKQRKRTGNYP